MTVLEEESSSTAGSIASIRVDLVSVPLPRAVRNGTALISHREYILVTVTDESGETGTACAFTRSAPLRSVIEEFIAPRLVGRSVFQARDLWNEIYTAGELFLGRSGIFPRGMSLVDIALWDLRGKLSGASLVTMLGGVSQPVPMLMAIGYYRGSSGGRGTDDLDLLVADYRALVDQGFRRFKIMAGGAQVEFDVARIRAVIDALPADATLAVDVNGAWSTAAAGLDFLEAVDVELDFIEDPFRPDNERALREFRARSRVPVAIGEWESGRHRFDDLIQRDLLDVARIDATACGGIGEWVEIAARATRFGKRIVPHYYPEIHLPLAAATPGAEAVEVVPALTGADNFNRLLKTQSWAEQPLSFASSEPGLGMDWDWEFIRAHAVH